MSREELARKQAEVLRALAGGEPAAAFAGLEHARAVLLGKRRREAALSAPQLTEHLGERFADLFREYAAQVGYPARGGPVGDAAAFGRWLQRRRALPHKALAEAARLRAAVGFPLQIVRVGRGIGVAMRLGR